MPTYAFKVSFLELKIYYSLVTGMLVCFTTLKLVLDGLHVLKIKRRWISTVRIQTSVFVNEIAREYLNHEFYVNKL